ncbi:hypothetical protein DFH09DRAFT_1099839 [Mycena vulgaris]|nr:hypothetical protein DFH09DRAFT_1099839 [Mycena vulgaris]
MPLSDGTQNPDVTDQIHVPPLAQDKTQIVLGGGSGAQSHSDDVAALALPTALQEAAVQVTLPAALQASVQASVPPAVEAAIQVTVSAAIQVTLPPALCAARFPIETKINELTICLIKRMSVTWLTKSPVHSRRVIQIQTPLALPSGACRASFGGWVTASSITNSDRVTTSWVWNSPPRAPIKGNPLLRRPIMVILQVLLDAD